MENLVRAATGILASIIVSPVLAQTGVSGSSETAGITEVGRFGDAQVFAGIRLWVNEWDIPFLDRRASISPSSPGGIIWRDEIHTTVSDAEVAPMPTIGVRYGKFLGSMTYFVPTSYEGKGGLQRSVERSEFDVNLGYFVLPSVLLSVGYKAGKIDRISDLLSDSEQEIAAVLVGVSASAPLTDRLSLYGNFAYGVARQESDSPDARGEDRYDARYTIGEVGMSFRLFEGTPTAFVRSASASLGYRVQSYTTEDIGLGTYSGPADATPLSTDKRDLRSSTNGFVLALVASF